MLEVNIFTQKLVLNQDGIAVFIPDTPSSSTRKYMYWGSCVDTSAAPLPIPWCKIPLLRCHLDIYPASEQQFLHPLRPSREHHRELLHLLGIFDEDPHLCRDTQDIAAVDAAQFRVDASE